MKKDCAYTRKRLSRYLARNLFLPQRRRIERHLAVCPVCRSEFDAVRRIDETRRILRNVEPEEGFAGPLRVGAASLAALRRLFFRPLWLTLVIVAFGGSYVYVIHPLLHDPDLERLDASVPAAPRPAPLPESAVSATQPVVETPKAALPVPEATPAPAPLVITITVDRDRERASIRKINDAMKEHALLRTMRFSDATREISGSLTAGELYTFFNRIETAGAVTYKRSRLAASGEGELVPFVMRLRTASPPAPPAAVPAERAANGPAGGPPEQPPARTDSGAPATNSQGQ